MQHLFKSERPFIILDGGLATEMETRGCDLNHELWSARILIENPDIIRGVHLAYLNAGADCIATATYQASIPGFMRAGCSEQEAEALIRLAVELADDARSEYLASEFNGVEILEVSPSSETAGEPLRDPPLIAASIGPYGAYLADGSEYRGDYSVSDAELRAFHEPRWRIMAESSVDVFGLETIPSLREARILLDLLEETEGAWAWFSFSCRDEEHISDGTPLVECARMLSESEQVVAVGVNCVSPRLITPLIDHIREGAPGKLVVVYPNSGESYDATRKCWTGTIDPVEFGDEAVRWFRAGASIIGGCCRTTPDHIRQIRAALAKEVVK